MKCFWCSDLILTCLKYWYSKNRHGQIMKLKSSVKSQKRLVQWHHQWCLWHLLLFFVYPPAHSHIPSLPPSLSWSRVGSSVAMRRAGQRTTGGQMLHRHSTSEGHSLQNKQTEKNTKQNKTEDDCAAHPLVPPPARSRRPDQPSPITVLNCDIIHMSSSVRSQTHSRTDDVTVQILL